MISSRCSQCGSSDFVIGQWCSRCAARTARDTVLRSDAPVDVMAASKKRLRTHILLAAFLFWSGLVWFVVETARLHTASSTQGEAMLPVFCYTSGALWYVVTKWRIWWPRD